MAKRGWLKLGAKSRRKQNTSTPDHLLAGVVLLLSLFGLVMIYDTSVVLAFEQFGDKHWFLKNQAVWLIIGIVGGYVASQIDYHFWQKLAFPLLVTTLLMLLLVLLPWFSSEIYGARTRLAFPLGIPFLSHLNIQPSELAKLTLVIYFAALFTKHKTRVLQFLSVMGLVIGLVMLEPDLGNGLLIAASSLMVYFASGANILELAGVIAIGALAAIGLAFSSEYRRDRLFSFLYPSQDPLGISYQINQILIALGSGGLLGLGLGHSRQKFQYLPEVTTDSIFAIIGEELGLVGALMICGLLFVVIWRGIKVWEEAKDEFGQMLAAGITGIIGFQTLVNLGGMTGLLPLTGVPLPFISYGGSSLTITLVSVGILLNISRRQKS